MTSAAKTGKTTFGPPGTEAVPQLVQNKDYFLVLLEINELFQMHLVDKEMDLQFHSHYSLQ